MRTFAFWLLGFVCGLFVGGMAEDAEARYRPIVATQDEAAITCGSSAERDDVFAKARQIPRLRVVRVNAIENMNPLFGCDPVAAVRAIAAAGYKPYVTVVGSPAYAKFLARAVGPLVDAWGVWNEVNLPSWGRLGYMQNSKGPSSYRKLIARMGRVLRRYDPGAKVRIGELAPLTGKPTEKATGLVGETRYMDRVLKRGATLRVDGLAVHAYAWYGPKRVKGRGEMTGYILMAMFAVDAALAAGFFSPWSSLSETLAPAPFGNVPSSVWTLTIASPMSSIHWAKNPFRPVRGVPALESESSVMSVGNLVDVSSVVG